MTPNPQKTKPMKKLLLLLLLHSSFLFLHSHADNTGQINGTVTDSISGEPLVGATIQVMLNGKAFGTVADIDGYYVLKPLQPGVYDVKISYVGYADKIVEKAKVSQLTISVVNVQLVNTMGIISSGPTIVGYRDLISVEPRTIIPAEVLADLPLRKVKDIVATTDGVYQSDDGDEIYFRGSRPEATEYYIDNMRVVGELNIPSSAIAEIMVYSGGIPARYGDVTGGVVVITTKSYNMYHGE